MKCSRCGTDSLAGTRFCGECGASLSLTCRSCGAGNPPDHKFCGHCGAALGNPGLQESAVREPYIGRPQVGELPGELKQVTVLFCDMVNSTRLTERLGAEAMRELVHSFLETSLAEVNRYGGTAPQFTGDGFMALFGAPLTQEDHVRRAMLAALAVQRALGGGSGPAPLNIPVRIGIHTGTVVFGPIADKLPRDYTVIGDTANIAARLEQAAAPGTILVSEATRVLAQGYARVEAVGALALKGKSEPIMAYRLLGISHRRSGLRESASAHTTTFVDRESEQAVLHNFLALVEEGHSQAVGIVGEPGIGKSRLVAEFHRQLADGRVSWVEGRCVSYGTGIPYWLALDLLRSSCGILETDTTAAISSKIRLGLQEVGIDAEQGSPILLHLLGMENLGGASAPSTPEAVKAKAFEILRQIVIKGSSKRAVVLVLEDLHWVDKISEEFLGLLAESAPRACILLLGTYRPGYSPPWIDKSYAGQTPLQPLSRADSLQMVRSVLRAETLIGLVTEEIVAKADGNPFFLEQLALHAGEARSLKSDLMVPDTIHDVVMARIDRLTAETKQLLQIAAVIGREFSLRLLTLVWNRPEPMDARLRELISLEFIYERIERDGTTYVFRHALTQEAAYGTLLERHRRAWHGVIGHALEQLYAERSPEVAELLAFHFDLSNETEKAVDYAILAGERAQRRWANSQALAFFERALHRLDAAPESEANHLRRVDAVIKQGELKLALGRHAEHLDALEQIRRVVEQIGDSSRCATWHYWAGFLQILTGGHASVAIGHCQRAAEIAAAAGFHELDGQIASCLAQSYVVAGELRAAIEAGVQALATFETGGNLWWASRALWHLSSAANCLGEWDTSLSYCRRALEYSAVLDDLRLRMAALWRTASAYIQQGDTERGLQYCDSALAIKSIPFDVATAKALRGYGLVKSGRIEAGIAELQDGAAWFRTSRLSHMRLLTTLRLAESHLLRGDHASARPLAEDVLGATQLGGYVHFEGIARRLLGESLIAESQAAANAHIEAALRIFDRVGAQNDLAKALVTMAKLRQVQGKDQIARQLLEQAYAIFQKLGTRDEPARVKAALDAPEHDVLDYDQDRNASTRQL